MAQAAVRLRYLLRQRHWQVYRTFCHEYDKAAEVIDRKLVGTWPSRTQLHRWLSGDMKGLPYPDHCRVLEEMFPGLSAEQLFEPYTADPCEPDTGSNSSAKPSEETTLFKAVAAGLDAPDAAPVTWGFIHSPTGQRNLQEDASSKASLVLPDPVRQHNPDGIGDSAAVIGRKLIRLAKVLRLTPAESRQLARLAGNAIDLDLVIDIVIDEHGRGRLSYRHHLLNLSTRPVTRLARELWFENTGGTLTISPTSDCERQLVIQRVHDTANLAKFACQISPPVRPGDAAVIGYFCDGGRFVKDHYWRQSLQRYTRHLTLNIHHQNAGHLIRCSAVEEHPDGSENSATEQLMWDYEGSEVTITLTRDYLRPNQAITLRWDVSHEPA
jgi:hypothetical protein